MKIYGGDWLTNAALVGYARIQQKTIKSNTNYIEITDTDLKLFTDRYFIEVLKRYMNNSFVLNSQSRTQLTKNMSPEQIKLFRDKLSKFLKSYDEPFSPIPNSFDKTSANQVKLLRQYQTDLRKFLTEIQKEFGIQVRTIRSVLDKNNETIEKKIEAISEKSLKFIPNSLARFYFNKRLVGNYSLVKSISLDKAFDEYYVKPAVITLLDNQNDGHITCKLCKQNKIHLTSFDANLISEGMFSSTMVSHKTFKNFFYNGQADLFVCKVCELLLLCTWAGFNPIPLNARDHLIEADHIFVNTASIGTTYEENENIIKLKEKNDYSLKDTIYRNILTDILMQQQSLKSKWVASSCFFVELKTVSRKDTSKPDFRYYHIDKVTADLFTDDIVSGAFKSLNKTSITTPNNKNVKISINIVDMILAHKSLLGLCHILCREHITSQYNRLEQLFNTCLISSIRNELYRGSVQMSQTKTLTSKSLFGILSGLKSDGYSLGNTVNKKSQNPSKSKSISYGLLEAIRNNNMNTFFDILIKLYLTNNLSIPENVMSLLNKKEDITTEKAYAFMSGFCSNTKGDQ